MAKSKGKISTRRAARLGIDEIARHLGSCPGELCDIVLALRDVVLKTVPDVSEAIKFNSLCYFKPDCAYGAIGGNVCMIESRKGRVELSFIHGASLPDPKRLLKGSGKAKRYVRILSLSDARQPAIRTLIRAADAYAPAEADRQDREQA